MLMPNEGQACCESFLDCQTAIRPLVVAALRASPSGFCDVETVLREVLPKARADGWQEDEVSYVLRSIGKACSEQRKEISIPVPPVDR
jgi:hypothetical protein